MNILVHILESFGALILPLWSYVAPVIAVVLVALGVIFLVRFVRRVQRSKLIKIPLWILVPLAVSPIGALILYFLLGAVGICDGSVANNGITCNLASLSTYFEQIGSWFEVLSYTGISLIWLLLAFVIWLLIAMRVFNALARRFQKSPQNGL